MNVNAARCRITAGNAGVGSGAFDPRRRNAGGSARPLSSVYSDPPPRLLTSARSEQDLRSTVSKDPSKRGSRHHHHRRRRHEQDYYSPPHHHHNVSRRFSYNFAPLSSSSVSSRPTTAATVAGSSASVGPVGGPSVSFSVPLGHRDEDVESFVTGMSAMSAARVRRFLAEGRVQTGRDRMRGHTLSGSLSSLASGVRT